jgi:hypothetical protein
MTAIHAFAHVHVGKRVALETLRSEALAAGPRAKPAPLDREEARRLCRNLLAGLPPQERTLLVEIDARGARLIVAVGAQPIAIWSLGLAGLKEDRAIAHALGRARLGFLRGWFRRGFVICGRPDGRPYAGRRETRLLGVLAEFLGLDELLQIAALGVAPAVVPRAA